MKEIYNLTEQAREEAMQKLFEKYMSSSSDKQRRTKWKDKEFVTRVIKEHIRYFTVDRNIGIQDEESIITEADAFRYLNLYNTRSRPNIDKLIGILTILDDEENIGKENANKICMAFGKIADSSKEKLMLQIKIINRFGYMQMMLENPQKFSISPEYLYARLEYYSRMNGNISNIPASRVLSDKDEYVINEGKKISKERKEELIKLYPLPSFDDESGSKGER